jgi:hypothetical protein
VARQRSFACRLPPDLLCGGQSWEAQATAILLTDLKKLVIHESVPWQDLSCLKFLPLEELTCSEDTAYKNNCTLRTIKTLRTINGVPAQQFWQKLLEE